MPKRVLILGAAGRDFHNFNVYFRDNEEYEVVVFTATQIPNIEGRLYPPELAGRLYPNGIPIESENELTRLIRDLKVDLAVFCYSDVPHRFVGELYKHFCRKVIDRAIGEVSFPVCASALDALDSQIFPVPDIELRLGIALLGLFLFLQFFFGLARVLVLGLGLE